MVHSHAPNASCSHHSPKNFHRGFAIGASLNAAFVAVEFGFGFYTHSLALIADAAHNLGDVLALLFAWLGYHLSQRDMNPSSRFSFGMGRVSIFAALFNGVTLVGSSAWIIFEALNRFFEPASPAPLIVGAVATLGIIINGSTAWLLSKNQNDINIKGAMIHMVADAVISAGVVITAIAMAYTAWSWLDPVVSVLIAAVILWGSWPVLREAAILALDGKPTSIDRDAIDAFIRSQPGVEGLTSLHIWPLSTSKTALNAFVSTVPGTDTEDLRRVLRSELTSRFGIGHLTLEIALNSSPQN